VLNVAVLYSLGLPAASITCRTIWRERERDERRDKGERERRGWKRGEKRSDEYRED
jgi:hypothetical protein